MKSVLEAVNDVCDKCLHHYSGGWPGRSCEIEMFTGEVFNFSIDEDGVFECKEFMRKSTAMAEELKNENKDR